MTDPQPPGPTRRQSASDARPRPEHDPADAPGVRVHLATLPHEGRFWDAFVEFVDDPARPDAHLARLCFVPADAEDRAPAHTAVIIIEPSAEAVLDHARSLARHQMAAMLRSVT